MAWQTTLALRSAPGESASLRRPLQTDVTDPADAESAMPSDTNVNEVPCGASKKLSVVGGECYAFDAHIVAPPERGCTGNEENSGESAD